MTTALVSAPLPVRSAWVTATSIILLIAALAGLALIAYDLLVIVPHFQTIFDDFGTNLPTLTRFVSNVPHPIVIAGLCVAAIVLVAKEWWLPSRGAALALNVLGVVLAAVAHVTISQAMLAPLIALIQKVSEGK